MGRKKSTEDKKKRDMGAPGTLETVSPTVEGSSDNRHTGFGWEVPVWDIVSVWKVLRGEVPRQSGKSPVWHSSV